MTITVCRPSNNDHQLPNEATEAGHERTDLLGFCVRAKRSMGGDRVLSALYVSVSESTEFQLSRAVGNVEAIRRSPTAQAKTSARPPLCGLPRKPGGPGDSYFAWSSRTQS